MSRGIVAFVLLSSPLGLAACGEAFTAVSTSDEAGAATELPGDAGATSLGGKAGASTRAEGGDGAGLAGETSAGQPSVLDAAGAAAGGAPLGSTASLRCPDLRGEKLVLAGEHCIDENEVTAAHYQAFVDEEPSLDAQPLECLGNLSFANGCKFAEPAKQPVRCVDWCDAHAYCASVGKRLCGSINGGATPYDAPPDSLEDQWYSACSHGGQRAYPYGGEYDAQACWGAEQPTAGTMTVKSASGCEGGYEGLFDMSGAMAEWVDSCSAAAGLTDSCRIRGGSSSANADQLRCDRHAATPRNTTSNYIGFRCCADAIH
jgi:formylglycine-generating enzyme